MRDLWSSPTAQTLLSLATLTGVAVLLLQPAVRAWAHDWGPWILVVSATTITTLILVAGNYRHRALSAEFELAPQDERLFNRLLEDLPPDRDVIARLARRDFRAKFFRWGNLTTLQGFRYEWDNNRARRFLDPELEAARRRLHGATVQFLNELAVNVSPDESGQQDTFSMSPYLFSTDSEAAYELERNLIDLSLRVVETYGDLLDVAHGKGLTSVTVRPPDP